MIAAFHLTDQRQSGVRFSVRASRQFVELWISFGWALAWAWSAASYWGPESSRLTWIYLISGRADERSSFAILQLAIHTFEVWWLWSKKTTNDLSLYQGGSHWTPDGLFAQLKITLQCTSVCRAKYNDSNHQCRSSSFKIVVKPQVIG